MFTLIVTTKPLAKPTGSVDMTRQEPAESDVSCDQPLNEESKETTNDLVCGNEKENVSPNNDSHTKSFDSNTLPPEDAVQGNPPEEAPVVLPSEMTTEGVTATERPTTSRGGVPSVIKETKTKEKPCSILRPTTDIIEDEDYGKSKGIHSETRTLYCHIFSNHGQRGVMKTNVGTSFQLHSNIDDGSQQVILPAQMSDHDFQSLADAIQCVALSTAPLAKYTNKVREDIETMLKERNHWTDEQEKQDYWNSIHKPHGEGLGPLQAKLKALEVTVQTQASNIRTLEQSVQKNEKVLKKHGVAHAY
mmetsp:Transcript_18386/g.34108  ORF Transcript_18386/g.34108 Transcript_18386/m.34108 type:complete len:304 (+) Transcript_18386:284-1195(+)